MRVNGKVIQTDGDFAKVLIVRNSSCGESCAHCSVNCKKKNHLATAKNTIGAKVGDSAEVYLNDSVSLKLLFFTFILPVILFIAVYSVITSFSDTEVIPALFAILTFALYFIIFRRFDKKLSPMPEIIAITENGKDEKNGT